jgi:hypothetical protein
MMSRIELSRESQRTALELMDSVTNCSDDNWEGCREEDSLRRSLMAVCLHDTSYSSQASRLQAAKGSDRRGDSFWPNTHYSEKRKLFITP